MNYKTLAVSALLVSSLISGAAAYAASPAVKEMAGILSHLNHYPSDSEKHSLNGIIDDAESNHAERTIAKAMKSMRHHVSASDRERLEGIAKDPGVDVDTRRLAAILASVNHHPGGKEADTLRQLMK